MDVERYIEASSLWVHHPDGREEQLVPEGELTVEELVAPRAVAPGALEYLRFIGTMGLRDSAEALRDARRLLRDDENRFRAGVGRLARGGLLPRIVDSLFSLSLLVRGSVPGATAAAAAVKYRALQERSERHVYHGRVVRQGSWTVCQYWFFFAYNSWRSGFHGVNDHESDWEMVSVYLYEDGGRLAPEWAAYASHDFHGADLRRRWDDRRDLELVGTHPVVNAGAGSHASYFRPGEYQAEVAIPVPRPLAPVLSAAGSLWRRTLGQGGDGADARRIPFIDFARADGAAIGPGQEREWEPVVISEDTPWVRRYRGMWGLYARDPISGENAPGGPMHERDGTPRPPWFDPLGFAALDGVAPPSRETELLEEQREALRARSAEIASLIGAETERLQRLGAALGGLSGPTHLRARHAQQQRLATEASAALHALLRERVENEAAHDGGLGGGQRERAARRACRVRVLHTSERLGRGHHLRARLRGRRRAPARHVRPRDQPDRGDPRARLDRRPRRRVREVRVRRSAGPLRRRPDPAAAARGARPTPATGACGACASAGWRRQARGRVGRSDPRRASPRDPRRA